MKYQLPLFYFQKPTHSLVEAHGQSITLPSNTGFRFTLKLNLSYISQNSSESGMKVDEIVDSIGHWVGSDTLEMFKSQLKQKQHPWLLAKGFKNSAVVSDCIPFPGVEACEQLDFSLLKNGERVQVGKIKDLLFDLQTIIEFTAERFRAWKRRYNFYRYSKWRRSSFRSRPSFHLTGVGNEIGSCSVIMG